MKCFFCTSIKIDVDNIHRKCEKSLKVGLKENGSILLVLLNMGAAPSSGHLLNQAKTINLINCS